MLYIGIDLGTSACKLLLTDETGDIKNIVSRSYPLDFPQPGWSEQDPAAWWQAVEEGIPALLRGHDGAQVAGIGAGGQMHGLVVLDAADRVIRPAILWNDGRTADEVDYLNETVGRETLSARTANIAFAGFTAPKLLWMKKHEPELFARIDKIMLPKDYINYRLTGVHCTDPSDASGMLLYDVRHGMWSAEMLGICGVRETQMPRVFPSAAAVGTVLPEVAARLGIPETTVVAAGAGDNAAAAVGTGTVGEGACNISIGTSGTIFITSKSFGVDPHNALHSFAHADGGYHLMGVMLSAASCNTWLMERILRTRDYAAEQAEIAEDRLGNNRVFFLPYLMGERSPINDTDARAAFVGMSLDTTRADLVQAMLEGVAFGMRDSLAVARSLGIPIVRSKICGGGAKSPLWRKIFANVLGIALDVPAAEEGPGMGGAMLAMVACGAYRDVAEAAAAIVRVTETIVPDPALSARYDVQYEKYRKLYPALKEVFPQLH